MSILVPVLIFGGFALLGSVFAFALPFDTSGKALTDVQPTEPTQSSTDSEASQFVASAEAENEIEEDAVALEPAE